jgi:type II secretory pathway pseudopilin PulG
LRRFTPIELAVVVALIGCLAAVALPAFIRELHASRFVEPVEALARMSQGAVAYADANHHFPDPARLTPVTPPRGVKLADPPGTWDAPTWKALDFRPVAEDVPHAYAYAFEPRGNTFVARAQGDLDGDGVLSTFEVRGVAPPGEPARVEPGMYVEAELE